MLSEQEFRTFLNLASIPLREMRGGFPVGISSGCLIEYRGDHWLLAVAHSTGNTGHWAVERAAFFDIWLGSWVAISSTRLWNPVSTAT